MTSLESYSSDDLKEELDLRERLEDTPEMIPDPDFTRLKQLAQSTVDVVETKDRINSSTTHYIYECVMETLFGDEVLSWIAEKTK